MTKDEARTVVCSALARVAPEVDPASLEPGRPVRDQVDLDSMDFLNFLLELQRTSGVDVPETAYQRVATLDGCIAYVAEHAPATAAH